MALGERFKQLLGDPTGTAPGIEDGLVTGQFEAFEHHPAPACLGCRDFVVPGRVPLHVQ